MSHKHLTKEQVAEFKSVFRIFDPEDQGEIATDQLEDAMKSLGMAPSEEELSALIADADEDGSGTIDFDEFLNVMAKQLGGGTSDEEYELVFEALANHREFITTNSLQLALRSIGEQLSEDEVEQMFREAVGDQEQISFDQFLKFAEEVYEG